MSQPDPDAASPTTSTAAPRKQKPGGYALPSGVSALEAYPIQEAQRRMRWGRKTMTKARQSGLRVIPFGRGIYVRGAEILRWLKKMEDTQGR